ncbi:MAG: hypothetical protein ACTSRW_16265 [Candidatus Helarchaeota archaeon]
MSSDEEEKKGFFEGWKKDLLFTSILIIIMVLTIILFFVPVLHMMMFFNVHPIIFIAVSLVLIPGISIIFLYFIFHEMNAILKERSKGEMDRIIEIERMSFDDEIDEELETKKRIISAAIRKIAMGKNKIFASEIAEIIDMDEGEVEDLIVLLVADETFIADVGYKDDVLFIDLPKQHKVRFRRKKEKSEDGGTET